LSEEKERTYTYILCIESRKSEGNAEVRPKESGWRARCTREGLYALGLVLCGSHGFQAGIFSADRQRGQNRRTQAKEREEAACHRPRIF